MLNPVQSTPLVKFSHLLGLTFGAKPQDFDFSGNRATFVRCSDKTQTGFGKVVYNVLRRTHSYHFMPTQTRLIAFLCLLATGFLGCNTSPEHKAAKFLARGKALLAQKDYPRAILEFRNATNAMPKDAEPYYQMGLAYLESGNGASALQAFQRATTLSPKHSGAQLKLAEFMITSKEQNIVREAVTRLQEALGVSPDNAEAVNALAIAEWRLGKPEDSIQRLEEALKRFPTSLQAAVTLARMKVAARDWGGAEAVLKKAVADAPKSSLAELALAELYISMRLPAR